MCDRAQELSGTEHRLGIVSVQYRQMCACFRYAEASFVYLREEAEAKDPPHSKDTVPMRPTLAAVRLAASNVCFQPRENTVALPSPSDFLNGPLHEKGYLARTEPKFADHGHFSSGCHCAHDAVLPRKRLGNSELLK